MRIAVIGLAGVGKTHVQKINDIESADLACVCDVVTDIGQQTGEEFKVEAYSSAGEMFDKEELDGVILATPPKSHYPLTKMAADKGVHVLAEKPMASTVEDCQKMIEECRDSKVTLMIGHKKRFVPVLVRLKELAEGELGPIKYMLHRYPLPWMPNKEWFWQEDDGGGPILENAVHAADTLSFLMGDVRRVYAEGGTFFALERKPQIDCAVYTLQFESGAIATVGAGVASMPAFSPEDFYVGSENGVAEVSGRFDRAEILRYVLRKDPGNVREESYPDGDAFMAEIEHFMECSRTGAEPRASGEAGKKAVSICRAVKKSVDTGESVNLM